MKKLIPGVLVLLVVAVAAVAYLTARRFSPEPPRATALAPAQTVFFAQLPDLRGSAVRFLKTGLFAIWQEPEVQAFLVKPREKAPQVRQWEARLAQLVRVAPGEAFVAVTSLDGPQPKFIAGFSFAGSRADAETLLAEPRAEFRRQWPTGKAESTSHKGAAIETFTHPQGVVAECMVRKWYFVANDAALLRATLDRYDQPAGATAGTLGGSEVFKQSMAHLGDGLDAMVFGDLTALGDRLGALGMALAGQPAEAKREAKPGNSQPPPPSIIAAGTRIEGAQMRDRVFFPNQSGEQREPLALRTMAFSGPETLLYYATGVDSLAHLPDSMRGLVAFLPAVAGMEKALGERGLKWGDFGAAFGPELGTTMEWGSEAAMPATVLAMEVRDAEKARGFVEALTGGALGAAAWTRRESGDAVSYTAPAEGMTLASPTIALTPRIALLGFSADSIAAGLDRGRAPRAGLAANPAYQRAAETVAPPSAGFGYLDAAALFDRGYRMLRPVITMALVFSEEAGNYIDAGRLPSAEAISRHLAPSVFSQSVSEHGTLIESTGTLTFNQLLLGSALAAAFPAVKSATEGSPKPAADRLPAPAATPSPAAEPAGSIPADVPLPGAAAPAQL